MIPMELSGVRVELPSNTPIVLLQETEGDRRILPILIGQNEATAIALHLEGVETPRPMTHDLIKDLLVVLSATLTRVVVTDLREKTFYAELHLTINDKEHIVSCRPSDAIAVAVRLGAPLFAATHVVEQAGFQPEDDGDDEGEMSEEELEQFRAFIDNVNPEDFES